MVAVLGPYEALPYYIHTYVVLSYHDLVSTRHLRLFVYFSVFMFFLQCLSVICP
jgi:hypothetical protein